MHGIRLRCSQYGFRHIAHLRTGFRHLTLNPDTLQTHLCESGSSLRPGLCTEPSCAFSYPSPYGSEGLAVHALPLSLHVSPLWR